MSPDESVAQVFLLALKSMPQDQKDAVLVRIAQDKEFSQDLQDLLVFESRRDEPSRSFRDYLAESSMS